MGFPFVAFPLLPDIHAYQQTGDRVPRKTKRLAMGKTKETGKTWAGCACFFVVNISDHESNKESSFRKVDDVCRFCVCW